MNGLLTGSAFLLPIYECIEYGEERIEPILMGLHNSK